MGIIVAIDLETTGLDPTRDAIIEIGAVRFDGARILDEWHSLINPRRRIPEEITHLTGINDAMVRSAPLLEEIIPDLLHFVGHAPILGHNVRFDLNFLAAQDLFHDNTAIDTYEIAAVMLPGASRYSLGALGQALGILLPATHRALDDAQVTVRLYQTMFERALQLPLPLLAEIVRLGEPLDWDANYFFRHALRQRLNEPAAAEPPLHDLLYDHLRRRAASARYAERPEPEPVGEKVVPLDEEEIAALLSHGGPFARHFPHYEERSEQIVMAQAVSQALSFNGHLMVEAGTGVGKSFAYLTPAALFARQNNTRVVISTNTINLQDQLINKDIPDLAEALALDLHAAVLKGRGNYLCPRRLEILRRHGPKNTNEMRLLAKVLVWLTLGGSGDRNELNLHRPSDREIWRRISAEDSLCTAESCLQHTDGACPFFQARQAAQTAHLLIVNHALLLADAVSGNRVLPDYQYLIVDEAHHLEGASTNALSLRVTRYDFERALREAGGLREGVLHSILAATNALLPPSDFAALETLVQRTSDTLFRLKEYGIEFFATLNDFILRQREGRPPSNYAYQERILPATRTQPEWANVEISWEQTRETFELVFENFKQIRTQLLGLYENGYEEAGDLLNDFDAMQRTLKEIGQIIDGVIFSPETNMVYWVEISTRNALSLHAAPLHVGSLVEKYLWHEKNSVVLTSATLTTQNRFDYLRQVLNADEADELILGSPFDYENATLLFVPTDIPEPNQHGFQAALNRALLDLVQVTYGRMLVLFTSYAQLKKTARALGPRLQDLGVNLYEQGQGASSNALLETFKTDPQAVLFGTRAFWEGVDVPGEALSVVVLTRLPFDVPSDPLIAARAEQFNDAFNEFLIPEAILRFRQGFGRLIRSQRDRGVVAILDKRVLTKRYGAAFLESLPTCTRRKGSIRALPRLTKDWLGL